MPELITGKHIHRRTFLRGVGTAVALPFLDAMMPAGNLWGLGETPIPTDRTRLVCIEMVHGAAVTEAIIRSAETHLPEKVKKV